MKGKALKDINKELKKENKALSHIGANWKERQKYYVALESHNIDFSWDEREVLEIIDYCNSGGGSVSGLMRLYNRTALDIRVLLFDLALGDQITKLPKEF